MLLQEVIIDNDMSDTQETLTHFTPIPKLSRSDVHFPLTTPRRRAPSVASLADIIEQQIQQEQLLAQRDGQSMGRLTIRARDELMQDHDGPYTFEEELELERQTVPRRQLSFEDLPHEVQGKVLDYIFGDMHSVNAGCTSLRGKSVASLMRHPRRKAVSDLALVSATWREMVQERIYRHIKIKGTRAGLAESEDYFLNHMHLTKHIRHIEFWVPVWGDKASFVDSHGGENVRTPHSRVGNQFNSNQANESLLTANDWLSLNFKLSVYSATLSQIFTHISIFFPEARVFTLEGGHCKKSNMIRHFPKVLFSDPYQALDRLPRIRTFAMRGAWNIMRQYSDWRTIEKALPNVEEWHCGYAKPRIEAEATINEILLRLPSRLRHVNISLDGMYSKDPTTLGSSILPTNSHGFSSSQSHAHAHLCERLGAILPQLESLGFTGKICECMWTSALSALSKRHGEPRLKALEIVVKSCCRQRVTSIDPITGETVVDELGGVMADGAGITNLIFIRAFERLVLHTVDALRIFQQLEYVRIRFIDLDSPCTLLNPYWLMEGNKVYGVWNEEIVETLSQIRPSTGYVELGDGIEYVGHAKESREGSLGGFSPTPSPTFGFVGQHSNNSHHQHQQQQQQIYQIPSPPGSAGGVVTGSTSGGSTSLYPRVKPRSIKTSSYKIVAETRGS